MGMVLFAALLQYGAFDDPPTAAAVAACLCNNSQQQQQQQQDRQFAADDDSHILSATPSTTSKAMVSWAGVSGRLRFIFWEACSCRLSLQLAVY